mmetsp:Transcript_29970/g.76865  ORF Transcript_29970/g.76865 Transcript_29970/m.76865 type:complete len:495 (-) Transcript_29970:211-1695(-)
MDRSRAASALRRLQRSTTTPMEDDYRALSMPLVDNEAGGPAPRSVVSDMSNWMGGMGGQLKGRTRSSRRTQGMSHVNSSEAEEGLSTLREVPQNAVQQPSTWLGQSAAADEIEIPGLFAPLQDIVTMKDMICGSYINLLLVFVPLGFVVNYMQMNAVVIFFTNFAGLVPLALILGDCTEDLAVRFGDIIGGLLNATFGNVVEMILSVAALQKELYYVVATSLMGSVLSNLLLVLGCCFFFGGMYYKVQRFNTTVGKAGNSLLMLVCIGIIMPTLLVTINPDAKDLALPLSRIIAVMLACVYLVYLYFQLFSHSAIINEKVKVDSDGAFEEEDEEEEVPSLSVSGGFGLLLLITVVVAFMSEFLTGSIEKVSEQVPWLNQGFLGMIVLPIAGNACEHITAVLVAMRNKMDLSIGVAVGSSVQIALFVIPFMVLAGWAMDKPFTLEFDLFAVIMLTLSVILASFVTYDGASNYLLGVQLICVYLLLTVAYLLGAAK